MTDKRAVLVCLLQGARRREFRYIYKPGNPPMTRWRAYLFHMFLTTTKNFNEIEINIVLTMFICEILLFLCVFILEVKIHQEWDKSFNAMCYLNIFQVSKANIYI